MFYFFFKGTGAHQNLPSFPTRRSPDLSTDRRAGAFRWEEHRRCLREPWEDVHAATACPVRIPPQIEATRQVGRDRKSTRLNSSHANISYAVFCLKKKKHTCLTPLAESP